MGVNGLWTVVQPCARPTNLATLNRKRLAVDASIWIYQFLKAVRDKEGNALRNSHVVGFFRRICKLLWFGIKPIFVFDGGAPALKRATLQGRRRRREGRREDAVRTAGKLLAVQMQRIAQEEEEKRKERQRRRDASPQDGAASGEELPDMRNIIYADEAFKTEQERKKERKFFRQDQYHLPELETSIEKMGKPEDPRIMSVEELEDYARQFHDGEDINLYDFSKIDFDGEFFKSLPPADRYNILNAARLRSRLRMGLSKEQLGIMFPNRMDFSRFQVERVQERNRLTQRLMFEMNMGGDLTVTGGGRVAGDRNREYILVRNESADGGWALGVVSTEKDRGEAHKPIDVDKLHFKFEAKDDDADAEDDDEDFEDVPIEGLNRLPKIKGRRVRLQDDEENAESLFGDEHEASNDLFVAQDNEDELVADEDEDVARAIEMSLRTQHLGGKEAEDSWEENQFEDVETPDWKQTPVEVPKPITSTSGSMVAHIINNRASAAVPKRKQSADSDSEEDLQAALRAARKKKSVVKPKPTEPIRPNVKNPFGGPLPFEKLNWRNSLFETKSRSQAKPDESLRDIFESEGGFQIKVPAEISSGRLQSGPSGDTGHVEDENFEGGFEKETGADEVPQPLPPWMINDESDIREKMQKQRRIEAEANEEDRRLAEEEERLRMKRRNEVVEIESSDDDDDGLEIVDAPPSKSARTNRSDVTWTENNGFTVTLPPPNKETSEDVPMVDSQAEPEDPASQKGEGEDSGQEHRREARRSPSSEMEFENVELPQPSHEAGSSQEQWRLEDDLQETIFEDVKVPQEQPKISEAPARAEKPAQVEEPGLEQITPSTPPIAQQERVEGLATVADPAIADDDDGIFSEGDYEEFSDPEEEQLLAQMAEEAEEHARFASQLNNRPTSRNQADYERELRALRTQQKKDRRDADEVTQIMVTECQALLRLFGIPYITAPMEAEAQCAELVHLGLVDGIVTDDSDIFLFGGTRVYKNMFNSNKFVECYLADDLEKELSLSRDQLISIAHLLGSDYTEGLAGIGPVTAMEMLSEFPGREGLGEFKEWWTEVQQNANRPKDAEADSAFRKKFRKSQATKLFLPPSFPSAAVYEAYLHPEVDKNPEQFQWGAPDLAGLRRFLMATIGWSPERTDEVLVPVIRDLNRRDMEGTQSNITRYFEGSVGVGAKEAFAPRQRQAGSKRMTAAVKRLRANVSGAGATEPGGAEGSSATGAAKTPRATKTRKRKARVSAEGESDGDDDEDDNDTAGRRDGGRRKGRGGGAKTWGSMA